MFMHVGGKRCPACGVIGNVWRKKPVIFICPICETIFNEFGLLTEPSEAEVKFT